MPLITDNDIVKAHVDEIPVKLIKENKRLLAKDLTILFNQSITTGVFPNRFKFPKIIPIHKSGSKIGLSNYRPISIFQYSLNYLNQ